MAQPVFPNNEFYSHMPFAFDFNGARHLVFTRSELQDKHPFPHRVWKITYYNMTTGYMQFLDLPDSDEYDIECNPALWYDYDNQDWHGSYSFAKMSVGKGIRYQLLHTHGKDLLAPLANPIVQEFRNKPVFNGFVNSKYKAYTDGRDEEGAYVYVSDHKHLRRWILRCDFHLVLRVNHIFDDPDRFLITGRMQFQNQPNNERTMVWNHATQSLEGELLVEGEPVYKSTIVGDSVIFAKRGVAFEDRQLYISQDWTIQPPQDGFHLG